MQRGSARRPAARRTLLIVAPDKVAGPVPVMGFVGRQVERTSEGQVSDVQRRDSDDKKRGQGPPAPHVVGSGTGCGNGYTDVLCRGGSHGAPRGQRLVARIGGRVKMARRATATRIRNPSGCRGAASSPGRWANRAAGCREALPGRAPARYLRKRSRR